MRVTDLALPLRDIVDQIFSTKHPVPNPNPPPKPKQKSTSGSGSLDDWEIIENPEEEFTLIHPGNDHSFFCS